VPKDGTLYAFAAAGCGGPADCPPIWTAPYGNDPAGNTTGPIWLQGQSSLIGLNRATGALAVERPLAGLSTGFAADASKVYATSIQANGRVGIEAFPDTCASSSCAPAWRSTVNGTAIGQPIVGGGVVYATVTDGNVTRLVAFDASGCGAAECNPLVNVPLPSNGQLSLASGRVYVTGAGTVTALAPRT
jgi:outer membrane protein assembly factor BamB